VQKTDAYMITVIKEPVKETTIADVIIGSLGITGILVAVSLLLGLLVAALRVGWNRSHPPERGHLPPISPLIPDPNAPRSSRVP
jgi:hypothetical protein